MGIVWILFLSTLLRLFSLNQSLWLDEAIQAWAVSNFSYQKLVTSYSISDFHPPFYHLVLKFWIQIFGTSEMALRMPSLIFGVLTVYLLYLLGKKIKSEKFGLAASLFLATSCLHIYYSQEARMYSLAAFLVMLSSYFFVNLVYNSSSSRGVKFLHAGRAPSGHSRCDFFIVGYFLATCLFLYTSYLSSLVIFGFLLLLLWQRKKMRKEFLKTWLLITSFAVFTLSPWLPFFVKQLNYGQKLAFRLPVWKKAVGGATLKNFLLVFVKFAIGRISLENKFVYGLLVAPVLVFFLFLILRSLKDKKAPLFISLFFVPLILSFLISFFVPAVSYFRLLFLLPFFYLLLTLGLFTLRKNLRVSLFVLILFFNLTCSFIYLFNHSFHRENWRGLVKFIKAHSSRGDVLVLIPSKSSAAPYFYYSQGQPPLFGQKNAAIIKEKDRKRFLKIIKGKKEIWYIDYLAAVFDPYGLLQKWLKSWGYVKIKEMSFNQILLFYYRQKGQ